MRNFVVKWLGYQSLKFFGIDIFNAEVINYPENWNLSNKLYYDKVKKQPAWINIYREFYLGFNEN